MRTSLLSLLLLIGLIACQAPEQSPPLQEEPSTHEAAKEMLLLGTFHFNNPGADVAKTKSFDILNDEAQAQLDALSENIKNFAPSKIFVEWDYDQQAELDSLYGLYQAGRFFSDTSLSDFYRKNEIFQLAFRAAHALGHDRVYAIDYWNTDFPYDSMMTAIHTAGQEELQEDFTALIKTFTEGFDAQIAQGKSLCEIYSYINSSEMRKLDRSFYTRLSARAGVHGDFTGAFLASEWYRRNLYMWSNMLRLLDDKDERIMVLLGASHVSLFDSFCENEVDWRSVSPQEVLCP